MKTTKDNRILLRLPQEIYQLRRELQEKKQMTLNKAFNFFLADKTIVLKDVPEDYKSLKKTNITFRVYQINNDNLINRSNYEVAYNFYLYLKELLSK